MSADNLDVRDSNAGLYVGDKTGLFACFSSAVSNELDGWRQLMETLAGGALKSGPVYVPQRHEIPGVLFFGHRAGEQCSCQVTLRDFIMLVSGGDWEKDRRCFGQIYGSFERGHGCG